MVAVHDPDEARATAFAAEHGASSWPRTSCAGWSTRCTCTTWTSEHPRLVERAAAAGVAVFCEKPLAVDAAAAARMVAAVEAAGVANQVGLVLRFLPSFLLAAAPGRTTGPGG